MEWSEELLLQVLIEQIATRMEDLLAPVDALVYVDCQFHAESVVVSFHGTVE